MDNWIETSTGNRIARLASINGAKCISISDNCTIGENCTLNGLVTVVLPKEPVIALGKYCYLGNNVTVEPPVLKGTGAEKVHSNVTIGNYTSIGDNSTVRLVQLGNRVCIGTNCQIGDMATINDCCVVEDNACVPGRIVIPPYSRVSGVPGADFHIEELGPGYRKVLENDARSRHVLG